MAIYTVSDLHGQFEVFKRGLGVIGFGEEDYLYVLGDAIDRGSEGARLLWYVMQRENTDLLIGNHEFMMLNAVNADGGAFCDGPDSALWLYPNGGYTTFGQYAAFDDDKRAALLAWLRERYVMRTLEVGGRAFCLTHSYYDPDCENRRYSELSYEDVWNVVWPSLWREDELSHAGDVYADYDYTFVCGHVPVQRVRHRQGLFSSLEKLSSFKHGNVVNIDGGCAMGERSTMENGAIFLRLDDMKEFVVPI